MTTTVDTTLQELVKEHDGLLAPLDIPRSWSSRELDAYEQRRALLEHRVRVILDATKTLTDIEAKLAPEIKWLRHLTEWKQKLQEERDATTSIELRQSIDLCIGNIDRGCDYWPNGAAMVGAKLAEKIREAGYAVNVPNVPGTPWFSSLPEVELRINALTQRRDAAQAQLDEALLSDADRETQAKESIARAAASNALPQRKTRGDGSQYDRYPDGRRVEVRSTPLGDGDAQP